MATELTVIYDEQCGFCRDFKHAIEFFDRRDRCEWLDLHSIDYAGYPVTEAEAIRAMQVVDGDSTYAGFYAARRIAKAVPALWPFYVLFRVPGVPWIGEKIYRRVAERRHCTIQQPD